MNKIEQFRGEYDFLSNFYPAEICWGIMDFPSVEHAYVFAKLGCSSKDIKKMSAGEAKKFGRDEFKRTSEKHKRAWLHKRKDIMHTLINIKFSANNPDLRQKLLDTGSMYIQEGNWWGDKFWGVDLKTGKGQNNLGKIIMRVRDEIRKEILFGI